MKKQQHTRLDFNKMQELEIDFEVDPRPLTKEEELAISEFIKADKAKRALLEKQTAIVKKVNKAKQPA